MEGTLHIHASDEPQARLLTDPLQIEHLFVGSILGGVYLEVTDELKRALCLIVQEWAETNAVPEGVAIPIVVER